MKKQFSFAFSICFLVLFLLVGGTKTDSPTTVDELLDLGEKYLIETDYEQALVQFLKVIELEPMNPRGYTGAAEAYIELNMRERAIEVLQRGLELLSDDADINAMLNEHINSITAPEPSSLPE